MKYAGWEYITLDDQAQFEIAHAGPVGFIRNLPQKRIALDEVRRLPELFVSIKQAVDEQRTPGRFLLTGSANAVGCGIFASTTSTGRVIGSVSYAVIGD